MNESDVGLMESDCDCGVVVGIGVGVGAAGETGVAVALGRGTLVPPIGVTVAVGGTMRGGVGDVDDPPPPLQPTNASVPRANVVMAIDERIERASFRQREATFGIS